MGELRGPLPHCLPRWQHRCYAWQGDYRDQEIRHASCGDQEEEVGHVAATCGCLWCRCGYACTLATREYCFIAPRGVWTAAGFAIFILRGKAVFDTVWLRHTLQ